jgi:predicted thioesterase
MKNTLVVGITGEVKQKVVSNHLVSHYHPEGPAVFGSPFMLMAMEFAAFEAIRPHLDTGEQSVGVEFQFAHLAATPAGATVTARAEVLAVEGQKISFRIEAHDEQEMIGQGTHVRHVIDMQRFLKRTRKKVPD